MWSEEARQAALEARQANARGSAAQSGSGRKTEPQTAQEFGEYVRQQQAAHPVSDQDAAAALASGGAKSAPVPVHSGAAGRNPAKESGPSDYPW